MAGASDYMFDTTSPYRSLALTPRPDFSWLGNLPQELAQSLTQRKQLQAMNAFPSGLPMQGGQVDTNAVIDTAAKTGGLPAINQLLSYLVGQQGTDQLTRLLYPGGQPPGTPNAQSSAAGARHVEPGGGPPFAPGTSAQPRLASAGTDSKGTDTLNSIMSEAFGSRDMTAFLPQIAKRLGMDVNQELTPEEADRVRSLLPRIVKGLQPRSSSDAAVSQTAAVTSPQDAAAQSPPQQAPQQAYGGPAGSPIVPPAWKGREREYFEDQYQRADAIDAIANQRSGLPHKPDVSPLKQISQGMRDRAKQGMEALLANDPAKLQFEAAKGKVAQSQKIYNGLNGAAVQWERDLKQYYDIADAVLNDPSMHSGFGAKLSLDINKVRAVIGDQKAAMLQEVLTKTTASSVISQMNTMRDQLGEAGFQGGRMFKDTSEQIIKAAPSLEGTLQGNRALVTIQRRMGEANSTLAGMARQYMRTHGILDEGWDEVAQKYVEKHPVFTAQEASHPELLGAPTARPDLRTVDQLVTWGRGMGLQPGDPFRTQSGKIRAMPTITVTKPAGAAGLVP